MLVRSIMERFVIRVSETRTIYMDRYNTVQECLDREEIDKKEGCYKAGSYEVYDNLCMTVVHG